VARLLGDKLGDNPGHNSGHNACEGNREDAMAKLVPTLVACGAALLAGCATKNIPNTHVEDTSANREVVDFVEEYRTALEKRDVQKLQRMASKDYFDDMGTPGGDDDVDYGALTNALGRLREEVQDARYQISYRGVTYASQDRVLVDVLYTGWFKVESAEGDAQWRRRLEPHRLVLGREADGYKILSGM